MIAYNWKYKESRKTVIEMETTDKYLSVFGSFFYVA